MRTPLVQHSVGFVAKIGPDGTHWEDPRATGFFVGVFEPPMGIKVEHPRERMLFRYFVTARHVVEHEDMVGKPLCFLVNAKLRGVWPVRPIGSKWWFHHSDKTADIAVIPVPDDPNAHVLSVSLSDFANQDSIDGGQVGVGDEVFIPGLFTEAVGMLRNVPIVRHGNIAMFPPEQIQTGYGYADAYLVEARSIGGLSGSPVFVRPTIALKLDRPAWKSDATLCGVSTKVALLGLMHGHWDVEESKINEPTIHHDRKRGVNLGIGIVVPAYKITETLNQPELVEMRKQAAKEKNARSVPGMDVAEPKEQPFTQSDFENALNRATRKVNEQ